MSTEIPDVSVPTPARKGSTKIILWLVILAIPVAGLVIWLVIPVGPEASAVIRTDGLPAPRPFEPLPKPLTGDALNRHAADLAFMIRDEVLLSDVIRDANVRETNWYKQNPDTSRRLETLARSLKVRVTPDTGIITISLRTKEPRDTPKIVNAVVHHFIGQIQHINQDIYNERLMRLKEQESALKRELKQIREKREALIPPREGSPGLASGINLPAELCRYLTVEQARLEIEVNRLKIACVATKGNGAAQDLTTITQTAASVAVPPMASAPNPVMSVEAEYLGAMKLQIVVQERLAAAKAELRDAERQMAQYRDLATEQALIEKRCERVAEEIYPILLMMRSSNLAFAGRVKLDHLWAG